MWQRIDDWLDAFEDEGAKRVDNGTGAKRVKFELWDLRVARPGPTWDEAVGQVHPELVEEDMTDE